MAIVTKYAGSAAIRPPSTVRRRSSPKAWTAPSTTRAVAIANGDNATSKIYLGKIRAAPCRICDRS